MGLYLGKEKISNVASVITQNADSMATEIQNHIANSDIHITADERTKWNAAADKSTEGSIEVSLPIDVEILETICENIEFTKTNNTYTFPTAITIDSDGLYYISYQRYNDAYDADNSGYLFSKPETIDGVLSVRWLSNDINNSITMDSTKIVDTWVGSSGKSIVSIYKVNIIANDEMKKAALLQEGKGNSVSGNYAHAEGHINIASGLSSHAEGSLNIASGSHSHAEGYRNEASGYATHVQGRYNIVQSVTGPNYLGKYCHIVGNGTSDTARSNAHTLDWDGNAWFAGDVYTGGTAMDSGAKKLATEVPVSTADNGKVLSVVNGAWAAATMPSGVYVGSYTGDGSTSRDITLEFAPKVMFILIPLKNPISPSLPDEQELYTLINGMTYTLHSSPNGSNINKISLSNNNFQIIGSSDSSTYKDGNQEGKVYNYILLA